MIRIQDQLRDQTLVMQKLRMRRQLLLWDIGNKMADTKIDLEPYDNVDLRSYSDQPTMYEEGTIGTMGMEDKEDSDEPPNKMQEETHDDVKDKRSWLGFLSVEYYQPYFDVTTSDVFYRVLAGMLPFPFKLSSALSSSADLYGPFWLCMTLIFTTAISGNLAALMSGNNQWEFHFHEVIVIATIIYLYTWCLPAILWLVLVWRNVSDRYSLIKIQSIYGYSMAIFIPLTLLWVINVEVLRWFVLAVAIVLSGAVLVQALWTPLKNETKQIALALLAIVFVLHAGVGVGFKFYYFSSSLAPDVIVEHSMVTIETTVGSTIKHSSTPAMDNTTPPVLSLLGAPERDPLSQPDAALSQESRPVNPSKKGGSSPDALSQEGQINPDTLSQEGQINPDTLSERSRQFNPSLDDPGILPREAQSNPLSQESQLVNNPNNNNPRVQDESIIP